MEVMMFCFTKSCNEGITLNCLSIFVPQRHVTPHLLRVSIRQRRLHDEFLFSGKKTKRERLLDNEFLCRYPTFSSFSTHRTEKGKKSENPVICAWEILYHVFSTFVPFLHHLWGISVGFVVLLG